MRHAGTQTVKTPRLTLRRIEPDDAEMMFRNWASDDEVTRYLTWPTHKDISVSKAVNGQKPGFSAKRNHVASKAQ